MLHCVKIRANMYVCIRLWSYTCLYRREARDLCRSMCSTVTVQCVCVPDKQELFGDFDDLIRVPAADRNKGPILEVLQECLPKKGFVFEVASGPGQHVVHFAKVFPDLTFLPSDCDVSYLKRLLCIFVFTINCTMLSCFRISAFTFGILSEEIKIKT